MRSMKYEEAMALSGTKDTKRQRTKFAKGRGIAYRAAVLGLAVLPSMDEDVSPEKRQTIARDALSHGPTSD
jgi:hypothetical protein